MCIKPSTPGIIWANAPKGLIEIILVSIISPTLNLLLNINHGSSSSYLHVKASLLFSLSMLLTVTSISSPTE